MAHLLFSHNQDRPIQWFDKYNPIAIKEAIVQHLKDNPDDTVEHCKEYDNRELKKYAGYKIINFYTTANCRPCKIILKGNKEYLKPLI
jgi:hypothetical protein